MGARPHRALLITILVLALLVSGCVGPGAPAKEVITFTTNLTQKDEVGREIPILPGAYSREPYTWEIIPSGGTPPYQCINKTALPGMLQFSGCTITGIAPKVAIDTFFPFSFTITDATGTIGGPFELSLPVRLRPPTLVLPTELPPATIGKPYEHNFCKPRSERELDCGGRPASNNPSGGVPPYTFSASGQPLGLSMGFNGVLKGVVRGGYKQGKYEIEVCVKDSRLFLMCEKTILPVISMQFIVPERLPAATIGGLYEYEFCDPPTSGMFDCGFAPIEPGKIGNPSGGTPPYTFSASGLPAGLSMDRNGLLKGTVAEANTPGDYEIEICVTDSEGSRTCAKTTLPLLEKEAQPPTTTAPPGKCTSPYDGAWSGIFTGVLYKEHVSPRQRVDLSFDLTLRLTCLASWEEPGLFLENGEYILEYAEARSSYSPLGCTEGCKPVYSSDFPPLITIGPSGTYALVVVGFPNGVSIVLQGFDVSSDGRQIRSKQGQLLAWNFGHESRCPELSGSCTPVTGSFVLAKQ